MTILNAPHPHYAPHFETHDLALNRTGIVGERVM
jgi:hypothetical protein